MGREDSGRALSGGLNNVTVSHGKAPCSHISVTSEVKKKKDYIMPSNARCEMRRRTAVNFELP